MKKYKSVWSKRMVAYITMLSICFTGCSHSEESVVEEVTQQVDWTNSREAYQEDFAAREPFDCLNQVWAVSGEKKEETKRWSIVEYYPDIFSDKEVSEEMSRYSWETYYVRQTREKVYAVRARYGEESGDENKNDYTLMWFDIRSKEQGSLKVQEPLSECGDGLFLQGFDCAGETPVFLFQQNDEEGRLIHFYAAYWEPDGGFTRILDLFPFLEEKGLLPENYYRLSGEFIFDNRGNIAVISGYGKELCILGEDLVQVASSSMLEGKCEAFELLTKTAEGTAIFSAKDKEGNKKICFYYDGTGLKVLSKEAYSYTKGSFINPYGELYCVEQNIRIDCRDLKSGDWETCYIGSVEFFQSLVAMLQNSEGELVCITEEQSGSYSASILSPVGIEHNTEIAIYSYYFLGNKLQTAVSEYQRRHPGVHFTVTESGFDERDADWAKQYARLSKGEGPDVLVLPRKQMLELAGKNALMELGGVLSEELRRQIFPAVLDYGKVEEQLYGMTVDGWPSAFLVSKDLWPEDSWTLRDIRMLMEEKEKSGEAYAAFCNDFDLEEGQNQYDLLSIFLMNPVETPFIDFKNKTCCFDTVEFADLLMLCKKYHVPQETKTSFYEDEAWKAYNGVKQGHLLCYRLSNILSSDVVDFNRAYNALGPEYHVVGFPSEHGKGNYMLCYETVCVRKDAKNADVIGDFLNFLYSREIQCVDNIVRRDLLRQCVVQQDYDGLFYFSIPKSRAYKELGPESFLEEYLELCENSLFLPEEFEEVKGIIEEEAGGFFEGDLSAETVAKTIQARVSLYLAELK